MTGKQNRKEGIKHFSNLFDAAGICFLTLDPEGIILSVNSPEPTLFTYSKSELNCQSFLQLLEKKSKQEAQKAIEGFNQVDTRYFFVAKVRQKDSSFAEANIELLANFTDEKILGSIFCLIHSVTLAGENISTPIESSSDLLLNEKTYKALVDSAAPAITTLSKTGFILTINRRLCEISGYSSDEFIGKHFLQVPAFLKKELPKYVSLYKRALRNQLPDEAVKFPYKHKNGSKRWAEAFLGVVMEDNKIMALQAVMVDITERVKAEEQKKQELENLDFLFNCTMDMLKINDEDRLYDYLAKKIKKLTPGIMFSLSKMEEDFSKLTVKAVEVEDKSLLKSVNKLMGNILVGKTFDTDENSYYFAIHGRLEKYTGTFHDITLHQLPKSISIAIEKIAGIDSIYDISLGDQRILGGAAFFLKKNQSFTNPKVLEALFRVASETIRRLRASRHLDLSEKKYRSLSESTGDWIIRFDREGRHLYVNHAVLKAFDLSSDEILGKNFTELYSPDYSRLIKSQLEAAFKSKDPLNCAAKIEIMVGDDFFEWCFYPDITDEKGVVNSVLVYARNISLRKETEGILLTSLAHKNKLYTILSHDLRNPFNSIIGFSDLLNDNYDSLDDSKKMEYIQIIRKTAKNSYHLMESILDWSKEYDNLEAARPVYFNLESVVSKVLDFHHAHIKKKKLNIRTYRLDEFVIHADYNVIFTIFRNLLSNAIKYSYANGTVSISAEKENQGIICKITDEGLGISEENVEKIIANKEYFSIPGAAGEQGSGTGLKLIQELIKSFNGKLWIESEEGQGTSIFFNIPEK